MSEEKTWQQTAIGGQMAAARGRHASFRLEAEVRAVDRKLDLNVKEVERRMKAPNSNVQHPVKVQVPSTEVKTTNGHE